MRFNLVGRKAMDYDKNEGKRSGVKGSYNRENLNIQVNSKLYFTNFYQFV